MLGHDELSRTMAEFDIHFKELEKEASQFQSRKESTSHTKENLEEVYNSVCKLDSNVYSMQKIFDSISHLLDEDQGNGSTDGEYGCEKKKKKHVKNRMSMNCVETKTIDFRPFLTSD